jgi:hypothetical protein
MLFLISLLGCRIDLRQPVCLSLGITQDPPLSTHGVSAASKFATQTASHPLPTDLQQTIHTFDRSLPITGITTLDEQVARTLTNQ